MDAGEGQRAVREREVRGDDRVPGRHRAARCPHRVADLDGVGVLVDLRELGGEREQVLLRVELGLVVEAHRPGHGVRQRRLGHQGGREAGLDRGLRLALDVGGVRRDVRVRGAAPEVAVDPVALHAAADPGQRALVGAAVEPGGVSAVPGAQLRVHQPVLGGHLGGGVAGHAVADAVGLQQHHANPGLVQQQRRRHADDAAADHGDVGRDVTVEPRMLRRRRGGLEPDRPAGHDSLRRSASSSRRISDSALRTLVKTCSSRVERQERIDPVRMLDDLDRRSAVHRLHPQDHRRGPERPALRAQPQPARRLGLDHLGVVAQRQRPEPDRVMKPRARSGEPGIRVADRLRSHDPVRVAVRVGERLPHRRGRDGHEPAVGGHAEALPTTAASDASRVEPATAAV